jgi:hypothetical protein
VERRNTLVPELQSKRRLVLETIKVRFDISTEWTDQHIVFVLSLILSLIVLAYGNSSATIFDFKFMHSQVKSIQYSINESQLYAFVSPEQNSYTFI